MNIRIKNKIRKRKYFHYNKHYHDRRSSQSWLRKRYKKLIKARSVYKYGISNELRFLRHCIDYTVISCNYPIECVVYCKPEEIKSYRFIDWLEPAFVDQNGTICAIGIYHRYNVPIYFIATDDMETTVKFFSQDDDYHPDRLYSSMDSKGSYLYDFDTDNVLHAKADI